MTTPLIYNEDGINWAWFTELTLSETRSSVHIDAHYRLRWDKYAEWADKCKSAPKHVNVVQCDARTIWRYEPGGNVATRYFVPFEEIGWLPIDNPRCIFDYDR